jgi:hypothetical protein
MMNLVKKMDAKTVHALIDQKSVVHGALNYDGHTGR